MEICYAGPRDQLSAGSPTLCLYICSQLHISASSQPAQLAAFRLKRRLTKRVCAEPVALHQQVHAEPCQFMLVDKNTGNCMRRLFC